MDISLPSDTSSSDKTPAGWGLVKWFLLRVCFVKNNRILWCVFKKWLLFSSPCQKHRGFYSYIHCKSLVRLLTEKLTTALEFPSHWILLEFLTLRLIYTEPLGIHQVQFSFSYPGTSVCSFGSQVSGLLNCDSLNWRICLTNCGVSGLPCGLTSLMSLKRAVDVFS